jgi:glucose dehydrogenase
MTTPAEHTDRSMRHRTRTHRPMWMSRFATAVPTAVLALGLGCAQLHFLKSASVPKKLGTSSTERGPAFSPATSLVASLQPNAQEDWTTYNRTLSGDRYALATAITPANAATLQRVCTAPLGERAVFQSGWTPRAAHCAGATATSTDPVPTSTSR